MRVFPTREARPASREGIPVKELDLFDAGFFGITTAEAELTDPQRRLILGTTWQALERVGRPAGALPRRPHGRVPVRPTNACLLERIAVSGQTGNFTRERAPALAGDVAKDRLCSLAEKADEDFRPARS
ncbi:beta-ketoacyl synthase N-terminal-like domain-containing protein [Streptomyces sp. NPDC088253]|uniref:beta-ketoacyl synthase N-terminal-like domain-containing protein n=1 Tax=Streptomyces sp. NPDC088253 TaxID=3365846 RepID=UPI00380B5BC8